MPSNKTIPSFSGKGQAVSSAEGVEEAFAAGEAHGDPARDLRAQERRYQKEEGAGAGKRKSYGNVNGALHQTFVVLLSVGFVVLSGSREGI